MSKGTITWISADKPPKDAETVLVWFSDDDAVMLAEYWVKFKCWNLHGQWPDREPLPHYWARINAPVGQRKGGA